MAVQTDSRYVKMVMSRRIEQGQATRRELLRIATRVLVAHGYQGTSIEAVRREAGISRGALYHHFDGKEALFAAVLDQVEADIAGTVAAAGGGIDDPLEAPRAGRHAWVPLGRAAPLR